MKFNFFKNTVISALALGLLLTSSSYAANAVTQQAYYDAFTFRVNGVVPYISDMALKPFTANNRIYIPIATLRDLGIASVEWKDSVNGALGEVSITPVNNDKSAYYEQKINELAIQIAQKDTKIKELEAKVKNLTDENTDLRKDSRNRSSRDYSDREIRNLVSDLEYDTNRDRNLSRVRINNKDFDVSYSFSYRRDFDINVYIKDLSSSDIEALRASNSRSIDELEYLLKDVSKEILRNNTFKNTDIYFRIYDSTSSSREIANYSYKDDRLRGNINR